MVIQIPYHPRANIKLLINPGKCGITYNISLVLVLAWCGIEIFGNSRQMTKIKQDGIFTLSFGVPCQQ